MPQQAWNDERERQYEHIGEQTEERGSSEERGEEARQHVTHSANSTATESTAESHATVGLLADPGLPTEIAHSLVEVLPELLARHAGGEWTIRVGKTTIGLDGHGALPMIRIGREAREREGWDAVVLLSDLPRRAGSLPVVADAGTHDRVGLVSLPALGALAQHRRARDAVLRLVLEHLLPGRGSAAGQDGPGLAGSLRRIDPEQSSDTDAGSAGTEDEVDLRLALSGLQGRVRLLAGLVRANRPWRLVPSLAPAIAAATAGAAFGIFYSNIWSLATALGAARHIVLALFAVGAMTVWLIANNHLWERRSSRALREEAILSNASTVVTIATGVVIMYGLLLVFALVAAAVVIPPDYLGGILGRGPGVDDYVAIGLVSCSMGMVAGALGSGFADESAVRQAAYSRREQERRARLDLQDRRSDENSA